MYIEGDEMEEVIEQPVEVKEEEKKDVTKGLETRIEYGTARQEVGQLEDFVVDKGEKLLRIENFI